ncbi:MAG: PAS domain S-box protein [Desulfobacterales bacterium]|nr:PAS domain S-box protein [Desulfobacterales bacterium]
MANSPSETHIPDYAGMKRILDYLKISYWLVDLDFVLMDVNETFLELTGAHREKLVGRNMLTLVQPEEAVFIKQAAKKLRQTESAVQFEFYVYGRKNKVKIPVLFHLTVNHDNTGRPVSFNMLLADISAQKKLEEKEWELFHVRRKIRQESLQAQMIGTGKAMEMVFYTILRCAEVDSPVLITGETGVGKEMTAKAIHSQGARNKKPFVAVNCGALPGDLLESELFGHVRGAFTGAVSNRPGLFREAEGGILFLDEIGDMEKRLQVKLLRAIQENEIRPVGDDRTYAIDLRIICATNHNLQQLAEDGDFRLDLYYRISVIPIYIPPLRERPEDIITLAEQFISRHPKNKRFTAISPEARKLLYCYHWPGNIRELQNAIEHALVMSREKTLMPEFLPEQIQQQTVHSRDGAMNTPPPSVSHAKSLKNEAEKRAVIAALERHQGNQTAASRELGISRVTLWRKKNMYNI